MLESLLLVDVFLTELALKKKVSMIYLGQLGEKQRRRRKNPYVVADDFKVELMALDLMLELELDLLLLVDAFLTGVDLITSCQEGH